MTMNPRDAVTAKGCIDSVISLSQNLARMPGFHPANRHHLASPISP
jgi:hypothetical protein